MEAAQKFKIKRVVCTSSAGAFLFTEDFPRDQIDESCFSRLDHPFVKANPYFESKTLAEQKCFNLCAQWRKEGVYCPEFVSLLPSLVFGGFIATGDMSSPGSLARMFSVVPNVNLWVVDIRDCSRAHLRALEKPTAANKRFIISIREPIKYIDLAKTVHEGLNEKGYNFVFKTKEAHEIKEYSKYYTFENAESIKHLGMDYTKRSVKEFLTETAECMIQKKMLPVTNVKAKL